MTLFIAESNDRVRRCLVSIAASVEGVKVVGEAGDVGEAIGGIKRTRPDSVIAAVHMSGGSGFDILSAAKSSTSPPIVTLLASGPCSECEMKCSAMGGDFFFEKSGQLKQIVTNIVLLAHNGYRQGYGAELTTEQDPTSYVSNAAVPEPYPSGIKRTICPFAVGTSGIQERQANA